MPACMRGTPPATENSIRGVQTETLRPPSFIVGAHQTEALPIGVIQLLPPTFTHGTHLIIIPRCIFITQCIHTVGCTITSFLPKNDQQTQLGGDNNLSPFFL